MRILRGEEWRTHDFAEERVAVIADGHDAARIVPYVVRSAAAVKVFQVEPDWVLPSLPLRGGPLRRRLAATYLRLSVKDAWTRRLLTPDHRFGHRRVTTSGRYYAALQQPNCKLIAWPVYAVTEAGIRTAEGIEHRADTLVLAADLPVTKPHRNRKDRIA